MVSVRIASDKGESMSEQCDADDIELDVFRQSDRIRDYVFPLGTVAENPDGDLEFSFLGTGFLIGSRGYALTAAHVIHDHRASRIVALFLDQRNEWRTVGVRTHCLHDREDVALLKLDGGPWSSIFRLSNTFENASRTYQMFGYPEDVATEVENQGHFLYRPDLIYAQGYIRRRFSFEIPVLRDAQFFELS
jgi:hypothetical protein